MPESKKKSTKAVPKKSNELKECQEVIVYLLDELEVVKDKLDKVSSRLGIN